MKERKAFAFGLAKNNKRDGWWKETWFPQTETLVQEDDLMPEDKLIRSYADKPRMQPGYVMRVKANVLRMK